MSKSLLAVAVSASISFNLPLNATHDEVNETIDAIKLQFGISDSGSVEPTSLTPAAQATTPAATATNDDNSEQVLDASGLPWDERIHAGGQSKNADGTWRAKRGVDKAYAKRIENQLRKTMDASAPAAAASTPAATAPAAAAVPKPPVAPGRPAAAPAPVNPVYAEFVKLVASVTISPTNPNGMVDDAWISETLMNYGIADGSLPNAAHRLDLIPAITDGIKQALGL